jgi:metal-dependent amidase/aminoacylase/carboxypeptidase family protein
MFREVDDFMLVSLNETERRVSSSESGYLDEISDYLDGVADHQLWPLNKNVHDYPQLGFKEYFAHELLTKFFGARPGWKVTPSAYGMATAWVAVWDTGKKGPVVSFNVEMGMSGLHSV